MIWILDVKLNGQKYIAAVLLLLVAAFAVTAWQFAIANNVPYRSLYTATQLSTATATVTATGTPNPLATLAPPPLYLAGNGPEYRIVSPNYAILANAFLYQQRHNLSCEAAAAYVASTMLNVSLAEDVILATLPRHSNPFRGFRGNVDGPLGGTDDYGVYAPPIAAVVNQLGNGRGLFARQIAGEQELRAEIAQGRPVVVWVTSALQPSVRMEQEGYYLVAHEHTVVVVGLPPGYVIVSDVGDAKPRVWPLARFRAAWQLFDYQGVSFYSK